MDIPTLPSDNLYKFLFFAGLAILFYTFIIPINKIKELSTESIYTLGELKKLQLNYDKYENEYNEILMEFSQIEDTTDKYYNLRTKVDSVMNYNLEKQLISLKSLANYKNRILAMKKADSIRTEVNKLRVNYNKQTIPYIIKGKDLKEQLQLFKEKYVRKLEQLEELEFNLKVQLIDIETKIALQKDKRREQDLYNKTFWCSFILGILLIIIGLGKWIIYQSYTDAVLHNEYQKISKSNEDSQKT